MRLTKIPFAPANAGLSGQALGLFKVWVPASAGTNGDRVNPIEVCCKALGLADSAPRKRVTQDYGRERCLTQQCS
jgi:hypothetical protein